MEVKRAADLYSQGWTLRQIGAELGVAATTVDYQLRSAAVTMRRGAPAHPASTQQIFELRDQGLTWPEIAEQVDMTVSGAWTRYRRARPPKSQGLAVGSRCSPTPWTRTLRLGFVQPLLIISVERPPGLSLLLHATSGPSLAGLGRARVFYVPGAHADANGGDRKYLVLAKPNVIMNDTRLRGLAVAGSDAAGGRAPTTTPRSLVT